MARGMQSACFPYQCLEALGTFFFPPGPHAATGDQDCKMASPLVVHVKTMAGYELTLDMDTASTVDDVRAAVSSQLDVSPYTLLFIVGADVVPYLAKLQPFVQGDEDALQMTCFEVDPMLDLGKFDATDIDIDRVRVQVADGPQGEHSTITAVGECTYDRRFPDVGLPTNVFLLGHIVRPCFVEFEVLSTSYRFTSSIPGHTPPRSPICFGVTYDAERIEMADGRPASSTSGLTWFISDIGRKDPEPSPLRFGGNRHPKPKKEFNGFSHRDRVMIIADPAERQVRFFHNDALIADNLPSDPLPEFDPAGPPLRVYCTVDADIDDGRDPVRDKIRVVRWGPVESLLSYAKE